MPDTQFVTDLEQVVRTAPPELKASGHWTCWRYEIRDGKPTKVPYNPATGRKADPTDAHTWGTFQAAVQACELGEFNGVGYVLSAADPFTGTDLDKCRNPATGVIEPWALAIITSLDSYTEVSPSGTGVKIIIRAKKAGARCRAGRIEIYDAARFFTITGNHLDSTPTTIEPRQAELDALYAETFPKPEHTNGAASAAAPNPLAPAGDDDVISILKRSKCGPIFTRLWEGKWENGDGRWTSQSEADLALVGYLMFMCGADTDRIDRLFRRSALSRDKWDRADYRERTLAEALKGRTQFYRPDVIDVDDVGFEPNFGNAAKSDSIPETPEDTPSAAKVQAATPQAVTTPEQVARAQEGRPFAMTDLGNAERFRARWGSEVRYAKGISWLLWNGKQWREDETGGIVRRAAACVRDILHESAACATAAANATDDGVKAKFTDLAERLAKWARQSESRDRINSMLDLARAQSKIAIRIADLDTDLWLLNCRNGTIDLRTGELRAHRREDLITKLAPVDFDVGAQCPLWHAFLNRIFANNQQLKEFAQRSLGYALTGVVHDHILHVLYGTGANGKSTFIETIAAMLGDYACAAAPKMLVSRKHDPHPTELADLRGARFVSAVETAEGGSFDEERVKALTGGDRIKARKMKQDFFEFEATHKLFLATNYRPMVKGDDNGIWRRIRLWPFTVEIPKDQQDPRLKEKLLLELAGILAWCVRGCLAWQEEGLCEAPEVVAATAEYREQQDRFGDWFAECCLTPNSNEQADWYSCTAGLLYKSYRAYAQSNGFKPVGNWRFTERVQRQPGITRQAGRNVSYFGVRLTDDAFHAAQGYHAPAEEYSHD